MAKHSPFEDPYSFDEPVSPLQRAVRAAEREDRVKRKDLVPADLPLPLLELQPFSNVASPELELAAMCGRSLFKPTAIYIHPDEQITKQLGTIRLSSMMLGLREQLSAPAVFPAHQSLELEDAESVTPGLLCRLVVSWMPHRLPTAMPLRLHLVMRGLHRIGR